MPDPATRTAHERATQLVELVRTSLLDARSATLLVEGVGRVGSDTEAITLCERRGNPVLLCPASGVLATAARTGCAAVLSVPDTLGGSVVFLGRLSVASTYGTGGERTSMLELTCASIVVEPAGGGDVRVDLARYAAHCQRTAGCRRVEAPVPHDDLVRVAEQIRVHTNHHHRRELLAAISRLDGTPPDTIAGARLAGLDRNGAILEWTDESGGHRLPLSFALAVDDPASLAMAVRHVLTGER